MQTLRMPQTRREHGLLWCLPFPKVYTNDNHDLSLKTMRMKPRDSVTQNILKSKIQKVDKRNSCYPFCYTVIPAIEGKRAKQAECSNVQIADSHTLTHKKKPREPYSTRRK